MIPVNVSPEIVPLTVKPEEIVPLPLIIKFLPAVILPVVEIVGILMVSVKVPVSAFTVVNKPVWPVTVVPETRVNVPVAQVRLVNCPTSPVTVAPDKKVVKTPETPVTFENLAVSPVIVAPERLVVKTPEIPVNVVALTVSPVTVAPETRVVPTKFVPVMFVPEILEIFALVPVRLNTVPVPRVAVFPVITSPLSRVKLPVPIVAVSLIKVVILPVTAFKFVA